MASVYHIKSQALDPILMILWHTQRGLIYLKIHILVSICNT